MSVDTRVSFGGRKRLHKLEDKSAKDPPSNLLYAQGLIRRQFGFLLSRNPVYYSSPDNNAKYGHGEESQTPRRNI